MDHRNMHRSSHLLVVRLDDQGLVVYDVSRCKCCSWTSMVSHLRIDALGSSYTVRASSPLPFSYACPTAFSNHTGKLNETHCILPSEPSRSAKPLRGRHLHRSRLGSGSVRLIATGFQCTVSLFQECS